jgi:hypothetical protein
VAARPSLLVWLTLAQAACGGGSSPADAAPDVAGGDAGADRPCVAPAAITQLAYATDGRTLAVARADGQVTIIRLPDTVERTLAVTPGPPLIALTEDGALLAASFAGTVTLWSTADGSVARTLSVGAGTSVSLKFSDSPAPLLLATTDAPPPVDNIKIWRIADGILVGQLAGSPHGTFTHADEAVLLVDEARASYQVRSFGGRVLREAVFPQPLARTAFAMDGAYLGGITGAGGGDERIAIMSVSDDRFVWQAAAGARATRQVLFMENPSRVVQLAEEVRILDHDDGKVLRVVPALAGAHLAIASPDGANIAAVAATRPALLDGEVILVSASDGSARRVAAGAILCRP